MSNVHVDDLVISDTPIPRRQLSAGGKYDEFFARMRVGQCVECRPEQVSVIGTALAAYLRRTGLDDELQAKTIGCCDDGKGRVWLINLTPQAREHRATRLRKKVKAAANPRDSVPTPDPDQEPITANAFTGLGERSRHSRARARH